MKKEINYKPIVKVDNFGGKPTVQFTIGYQTFHLMEVENKTKAKWFARMLRIAFRNLSNNPPRRQA